MIAFSLIKSTIMGSYKQISGTVTDLAYTPNNELVSVSMDRFLRVHKDNSKQGLIQKVKKHIYIYFFLPLY